MNEVFAQCPFFLGKTWRKGGNNFTITCETIKDNMGFDVKNMLSFRNDEERKVWMELFCEDDYEECPYCQQIYKKYKERLKWEL